MYHGTIRSKVFNGLVKGTEVFTDLNNLWFKKNKPNLVSGKIFHKGLENGELAKYPNIINYEDGDQNSITMVGSFVTKAKFLEFGVGTFIYSTEIEEINDLFNYYNHKLYNNKLPPRQSV